MRPRPRYRTTGHRPTQPADLHPQLPSRPTQRISPGPTADVAGSQVADRVTSPPRLPRLPLARPCHPRRSQAPPQIAGDLDLSLGRGCAPTAPRPLRAGGRARAREPVRCYGPAGAGRASCWRWARPIQHRPVSAAPSGARQRRRPGAALRRASAALRTWSVLACPRGPHRQAH